MRVVKVCLDWKGSHGPVTMCGAKVSMRSVYRRSSGSSEP